MCELAYLALLQPRVMLLDEPSAGPEVDRLGPLLLWLRTELDVTMIVVAHDLGLITSIVDRVLTMAHGRILLPETDDAPRASSAQSSTTH